MSRVDQKYAAKWESIVTRNFKGQACWFLNGFWATHEKDAETIWKFVQTAGELCKAKKAEGSELDEFEAHIFLEKLQETHTVVELRKKLATIDIDMNRRMALIEYLIFKFDKDLPSVINAPQGGENKEELAHAQALVAEAEAALQAVLARLEEQKQATLIAKQAEAEAIRDEKLSEDAKNAADRAEAEALAAEEAQRKVEQELKEQQESLARKIADLEAVSKDESKSTVAKSKAANEAAQLKSQDPLPLQRAKIDQGAAVRTAERFRKLANEQAQKAADALAQAQKARAEAVQRRLDAEEATRQVELAVEEGNKKMQEAFDYLEEVKSRPGQSFGDLWFLSRELEEKRKYMPKSKGGNW